MINIIEYINEAVKVKMSKVFTSQDKLKSHIISNGVSSSSLPSQLSNNEYNAIADLIWKNYKAYPNAYIFDENNKVFLARTIKYNESSGRVNGASIKYFVVEIFMYIDYKLSRLKFKSYDSVNGVSGNVDLMKDFKSGISLNELLKKYNYENTGELSKEAKEYINTLK